MQTTGSAVMPQVNIQCKAKVINPIMNAHLAQDFDSPRSFSWIIFEINLCNNIPCLATLMHELLQQLLSARDKTKALKDIDFVKMQLSLCINDLILF